MAIIQNLFRLRIAEQAQPDDQFLALFSGHVVELLPANSLWDRLIKIESAPGGGKTSLLRLFTPASLNRIYRVRNNPEMRELYKQLVALGAIDSETGVSTLGVLVNCHHDYSQIDAHDLSEGQKRAWFMSLLDARVTLLVLRAALQMTGLRYPRDVSRVSFVRIDNAMPGRSFDDELSGQVLFEESRDVERRIAGAINRLGRPDYPREGHVCLEIARLLTSHEMHVDDKRVTDRVLLMFDEIHTLAASQRDLLEQDLTSHDVGIARWTAMRLTALTPTEAMSETSSDGREFMTVRLEDWSNPRADKWLIDIARKRAIRAVPTITSFETLLADDIISDQEYEGAANAAREEQQSAVELAASHTELFSEWIGNAEATDADSAPLESATTWSRLKILIERRIRRRQAEFNFVSIPVERIDDSASILEAARLFVAERHGVPYYYGVRKVAQLGSGNVNQFLQIAGELFEAIINAGILTDRASRELSAWQQDRIVRAMSRRLLNRVRHDLPSGHEVHALLSAAGELAKAESYRPTAPYAPGVTGFAISMADRQELLSADEEVDSGTARVRRALHAAISHNLLTPHLDRRAKGGEWMVLYLNRLLCPVFSLPLGQGGYREQSLAELRVWLNTGRPSSIRQARLA